VVPTLALYDTMQYIRSKTATVCYGMCLGMGGFLLTSGGEKVSGSSLNQVTVAPRLRYRKEA
jgi:ATP-dependent protease ClpP protease subunit